MHKSAYPNNMQNSAAFAAQAYNDQLSSTDVAVSPLDAVTGRLNEVLNFANHQGERLEVIEARLNGGGALAGNAGANQPRAVSSGLIGKMNDALDEIMARLQRTDGVITRVRDTV